MRILAIDTSATLCAACVYDTQAGELGRSVLNLGKGHAEHLIGVIDKALQEAGLGYPQIDALAVSIGPGSFTGVRVGVATARGLALALKTPALGVTTLEAIAAQAHQTEPAATMVRIEAGRGQAYLALFAADGRQIIEPEVVSVEEADRRIASLDEDTVVISGRATADILIYARLAADKLSDSAHGMPEKPRPLYLRDADAKPQADFTLPRKTIP